jgi:hypothetical protein
LPSDLLSRSLIASMLSRVFMVVLPPFWRVTLKLRTANMRCPFAALNRSLTCAFTSFSFAIFGSCMNAPPLVFGGWSPVVAYLRHSMMVCSRVQWRIHEFVIIFTVLPLPFWPTMTVTGWKNSMTEIDLSSNDLKTRFSTRTVVGFAG